MKLKSLALAAILMAAPLPAYAAQLAVAMNQSDVIHLEGTPATVIVTNPMVADASPLDGNLLVIHGRIFGTTSVIVLDADGNEILDATVTVRPAHQYAVALHRGPGTVNYACAPVCARILSPGDDHLVTEQLTTHIRSMQAVTQRATDSVSE